VKPSVGRIVHYMSHGTPSGEFLPECRAAIITEAPAGTDRISLAVLNPTGMYFNRDCPYDETGRAGGTWHWPERTR
jgi:hypothetical protein